MDIKQLIKNLQEIERAFPDVDVILILSDNFGGSVSTKSFRVNHDSETNKVELIDNEL